MHHTNMRSFSLLLISQAISLFGSVLTGFALAIWAFQESGSQTSVYAAIAIANGLPIFLLGPIAGAAADRWNRKKIILVAQTSAITITAILTLLYYSDTLAVWHIIALVALNSIFAAFVLPTLAATVPLLVPKGSLVRANGLIALSFGVIELASPAISGALYEMNGLKLIFLIDLGSFMLGITAIVLTKIPQPPKGEISDTDNESFTQSVKAGIAYVWQTPSILHLIVFFAFVAAMLHSIGLLVQPMLLGFASASSMGAIMSFAGAGVLFGSLLLIPFNNISRHMPIIFSAAAVIGIACIFTPISRNGYFIAIGGFILMSCFPILDTNCRALFQRKIEPGMLGRVIGIRNFALGIFQSAMIVVCGLSADRIFEPAMADLQASDMSATLGHIYSVGAGRGIAVLISCLGIMLLCIIAAALLNPRLRNLDSDLEDIDLDALENIEPSTDEHNTAALNKAQA